VDSRVGSVIAPAQLALCPGLSPSCGIDRQFEGCGKACLGVPRNGNALVEVERSLVVSTLERTGWNVTRSAKLLGVTRDMMRYRIEKLGLSRPGGEPELRSEA